MPGFTITFFSESPNIVSACPEKKARQEALAPLLGLFSFQLDFLHFSFVMHEQFSFFQRLDELLSIALSFATHFFLVFPSNFKLSFENKYE